jgi:hypothetical protein
MDILPAPKPGSITAGFGASAFLPTLLAELVLRGPVTVLDGGNRFPAYRIAREIRKRSIRVCLHHLQKARPDMLSAGGMEAKSRWS